MPSEAAKELSHQAEHALEVIGKLVEAKTIHHTVVKGESLWKIAKQVYKSPLLWRKIYEANRDKIKNPNLIYPGQDLVIPAE
ncbi:MAG: LysM peptidoglycan-binding domain-containing protein [bacterium]